MNAVGIDVSKGRSTVAVLRPFGEVVMKPRDFIHSGTSLASLCETLLGLGSGSRVIMEATGRYHEPIAAALMERGFFVSVLNPILIKQSGGGSVRKQKTDEKDALKIAKYGLDNWSDLREHTTMDATRQQLKLFSRQYNHQIKTVTGLQNNLISLLDKTFPGANELFTSPAREDGHKKWVDFVVHFWHCDCVRGVSEKVFVSRYERWCKRFGYRFSQTKAQAVYSFAADLFPTLPKNPSAKLLIASAADVLKATLKTMMAVRSEVIRLAKELPEYEVVRALYGCGDITAAQLVVPDVATRPMAEIGDIRRFNNRGALIGFAGVDPSTSSSGKFERGSNPTSKRGSPHLRKTLFQICSTHLKRSPPDEPVYQFLDKKRKEGKAFYVYMTAAANKFLRIYHARVKEYLAEGEKPE